MRYFVPSPSLLKSLSLFLKLASEVLYEDEHDRYVSRKLLMIRERISSLNKISFET